MTRVPFALYYIILYSFLYAISPLFSFIHLPTRTHSSLSLSQLCADRITYICYLLLYQLSRLCIVHDFYICLAFNVFMRLILFF